MNLEVLVQNLAFDELIEFVPPGAREFLSELEGQDVVELEDAKQRFADLIVLNLGDSLLQDDAFANRLIEMMTAEQLKEAFPVLREQTEISPAHYDFGIDWIKKKGRPGSYLAVLCGRNAPIFDDFKKPPSIRIKRLTPSYGLFPYQSLILDKLENAVDSGDKRLLLHLPTGAGKTRTGMAAICSHLGKQKSSVVLWLADREELCDQAYREFTKAWTSLGNRDLTVLGFYGDVTHSLAGFEDGLIVASVAKLQGLRKQNAGTGFWAFSDLLHAVDFVVFDEAHKIIAKTYRDLVEGFLRSSDAVLVGLTATPGRNFSAKNKYSDGDKALAKFFEAKKISMEVSGYHSPVDYLIQEGYLAKANFHPLEYESSDQLGAELEGKTKDKQLSELEKESSRNSAIINAVKTQCEQGKQVIVFACSVEHSVNIAIGLAWAGVSAASVDSKFDNSESRRQKIEGYRNGQLQVLTNFGVLVAGFDAPATSVVVIAKPTASLVEYSQMAGRAMRGKKSGGNSECDIVTVRDDIKEFINTASAFQYWNDLWAES